MNYKKGSFNAFSFIFFHVGSCSNSNPTIMAVTKHEFPQQPTCPCKLTKKGASKCVACFLSSGEFNHQTRTR